jgi:hypothetical protein
MEVFGGRENKSSIWKIQLNNEDPKTIDIDLRSVTIRNFVATKLLSFLVWQNPRFVVSKQLCTLQHFTLLYILLLFQT